MPVAPQKIINKPKKPESGRRDSSPQAGTPEVQQKIKKIKKENNPVNSNLQNDGEIVQKKKKLSQDAKETDLTNKGLQSPKLKSILKRKKEENHLEQPSAKSENKNETDIINNTSEADISKVKKTKTKIEKLKTRKTSRVVPLKQTENTTDLKAEENNPLADLQPKQNNVELSRKGETDLRKEVNETESRYGKRRNVLELGKPVKKKRKVNIVVDDRKHIDDQKSHDSKKISKHHKKKKVKTEGSSSEEEKLSQSPTRRKKEILQSKTATLRLVNRRLSIGLKEKDPNPVDPLEAKHIKDATNYKEWSMRAHQALPSKAGVEVSQSSISLLSTLLPVYDATKNLNLNPKDTINSLRQELARRGTVKIQSDTSFFNFERLRFPGEFEHKVDESQSIDELKEIALEKAVRTSVELDPHEKIMKLRVVADHLTNKRNYKKDILAFAELQGPMRVDLKEKLKHYFGLYLILARRFFRTLNNWSAVFVIWKNHLRQIEGNYGVDAYLYFSKIRSSVFVNFVCVLISLLVLVIPEIYESGFMETYKDISHIRVRDIFTGEGHLMDNGTKFYYNSFAPTPGKTYFQSNPFRFCLALIFIFVLNACFIGFKVSKYYHSSRLESKIPGLSVSHSLEQLICAWDFSISTETFAKLRRQNIARGLRAQLCTTCEVRKNLEEEDADGLSQHRKFLIWLFERYGLNWSHWILFTLINLFAVIYTGVNGTIMYFLTEWRFGLFMEEFLATKEKLSSQFQVSHSELAQNVDIPVIYVLLPTLWKVIAGQIFIILCSIMARHERWKSIQTKLVVHLSRVGFFWTIETVVMYICIKINTPVLLKNKLCWETSFGSEFYRVIYLQEVVCWLFTLVLDRYQMQKKYRDPTYVLPTFESDRFTFNLIYFITLASIAFMFCPLIRVVVLVRLLISFYHAKYVLMNCTSTPSSVASGSHQTVPYLMTTCFCYMISSSLNLFLMLNFEPSRHCGPFDGETYVQSAIEGFGTVWRQFSIVFTLPSVSYTFIFLCIGAFYTMKSWAHAHHLKMIKLHELLTLEKQDREFLMKAIFNIGKISQSKKSSRVTSNDAAAEVREAKTQSCRTILKWKRIVRMITLLNIATRRELPHVHFQRSKNDFPSKKNILGKSNNFVTLEGLKKISSRRMTDAEKLYHASRKLSCPHHATLAHKAIEDLIEKTEQNTKYKSHKHVNLVNDTDENMAPSLLHHTMSLMVINELQSTKRETSKNL